MSDSTGSLHKEMGQCTLDDGTTMSLTYAELDLFTQLFLILDCDRDELIQGKEGSLFLRRSNLPNETLREIWRLASGGTSSPHMSRDGWFATLKLVALSQVRRTNT